MNGGHITGTGLGGLVGIILAALGKRIGLTLDDATSAMLGAGCVAAGLAVGHAVSVAWQGAGILPSLRRGFLGPRSPKIPASALPGGGVLLQDPTDN